MTGPGSGAAKGSIYPFASDPIDLSIIIVTWNVSGLLADCLHSIVPNTSSLAVEVIVVDNASSDGTADRLQRDFGWVRVLANDCNLGFARANNQALAMARGRFILFLNPDARL